MPPCWQKCTSTLNVASRYGGLAGYLLGSRQKPLVRGAVEDFAVGAPKVPWSVGRFP